MCLNTWAAWPLGNSIVVRLSALLKLLIEPVKTALPFVSLAYSCISSYSAWVIGTLLFLPLFVSVKLTWLFLTRCTVKPSASLHLAPVDSEIFVIR